MRIVIVSDTHHDLEQMMTIKNNVAADLYLHAGDSCLMEPLISPYMSVKGNCDAYPYPKNRVIPLEGDINLYMTHGNYFGNIKKNLLKEAIKNNCQIVVYGHTHVAHIENIENVFLVNPGSLKFPRTAKGPSYAIIDINIKRKEAIIPKIVYLNGKDYE